MRDNFFIDRDIEIKKMYRYLHRYVTIYVTYTRVS